MNVYIILGIVAILGLYLFICYNSFVRLSNQVDEAFSTMDVYLKKRWDLIPNIIKTVKGYAKHEKDTLKEVVELRNSITSYEELSDDKKIKTNEKMENDLTRLMALAEAYPDLKANKNFLDLQKELTKVEDEIAQSRKYYNAVVRKFNNKVEMIPSNVVAKILGYKTKTMFEATKEERENVKAEL